MIYLSSFFKSKELPNDVLPFSAAVYQPKGYTFEKAAWTDIRNDSGEWTRPRDFLSSERPLEAYRSSLYGLYQSRTDAARQWLGSIGDRPAALLCWCPFDKAAQRQLKQFGSFVCHTAVLGEFLSVDLGVPVWYDSDRLRLAVLTQRTEQ